MDKLEYLIELLNEYQEARDNCDDEDEYIYLDNKVLKLFMLIDKIKEWNKNVKHSM